MEGANPCPRCQEVAVVFDFVQGVLACERCGAVVDEEQLVQHVEFNEKTGAEGVLVGEGDTGERAGAFALPRRGAGLAIQRSHLSGSEAQLKRRLREVAGGLRLPRPSTEQAVHLLERAVPLVMQPNCHWRREHLVGAAAYAACRLNRLPVTLVDLSGIMHIDPYTLGRHYRALVELLQLQPPVARAADLLPRSVDRVLSAGMAEGLVAAGQSEAVRKDAELLLGWMERQLPALHIPLGNVAAAIVLAAEMNRLRVTSDHASRALSLGRRTLESKLLQMKRELLRLAPLLPYGASITDNTLASHARTIVRLSGVVAAAGGDGGASASSGAAPAIPGGEGGPGLASASAVFLERQQEAAAAAAAAEAALEADEGGEGLALVGRGPKRRRRGRPGQQQQQQTSEGADEEQTQGDGLSDLSDSELDQYVLPSPRRKQPLLRAQ